MHSLTNTYMLNGKPNLSNDTFNRVHLTLFLGSVLRKLIEFWLDWLQQELQHCINRKLPS